MADKVISNSKLLKSNEVISAFLSAIPDLVFVQDLNGVYIDYFSPDNSKLFLPPEVFIGKSMYEILPEYIIDKFSEVFDKVVKSKKLQSFEYHLELPDGIRYFEIRLNPYEDDKIFSIVRDNTEKVRAEQEKNHKNEFINLLSSCSSRIIRAKENQFDSTINSILEEVGEFSKVNRTYIFGLTKDKTGLTNTYEWCSENTEPQIDFLNYIPVEAIPEWMNHLNQSKNIIINDVSLMTSKWKVEKEILEAQDIKSVIVIPINGSDELLGCIGFDAVDRQVIWTEEDASLLRILADNLGAYFERVNIDKIIKENELKYREIFESIVDIYFELGLDGKIIEISPSVYNTTGYFRQEVIGVDAFSFFKISQSKDELLGELLRKGFFTDYILNLTTKNEKVISLSANVNLVKDERGNPIYLHGTLRDITERLDKEKQISRLAAAVTQSPASVMITDNQGIIEYINPIFTQFTGYEPSEVIGKKPSILKSGMMDEIVYQDLWKTITKGEIWHGEFINKRKDGSLLWETNYISPILDSDGSIMNFVSVNIDITERKRVERELLRNHGLITSLLDSIPDLIFYKDINGVYLGCNPPFIEFIGKSKEDIIGKADYELFEKDVADSFRFYDKLVYEKMLTSINEESVVYPDGSIKVLSTLKTPYLGQDGEIIGVLGVSRDITEKKKQELALEEARIRLELAMEAGEHGIWDWDLVTNQTYFNSVYYTMLGYEDKELPMNFETFDKLIHKEDKLKVMPVISPCIEQGIPYEVEFRLLCKNGNYKWITGKGKSYFSNETGKPYRVVGIHIDIDARKKAEEKLKESEARTRSIIDSAPIGIANCKSDSTVVMINHYFVNLLNINFDNIITIVR